MRLVTMRVNTARSDPEPPSEWVDLPSAATEPKPEPPQPHHEDDHRRCTICRCAQPRFGFGPPLTRAGNEVWSCSDHRVEVETRLTTGGRKDDEDQPR